jgi:predicted Zn-dependent peptidase
MFILVVGTAAESKLARKRFGATFLSGPVVPLPDNSQFPASKSRFAQRLAPGRFVRLCFGLPGLAWSDPRLPALDILNGVLGRDETSHLWERIRGQGLSYSTESFVDCFSDTGWVGVLTDAPIDSAGDVVRIVTEEIATLPERVTSEECERARASHIARIRNDEVASPLEWAKYQALHAYFLGRVPTVDSVVSELESVSFADIRRVASEVLRPDSLVLAAAGPRKSLRDCQVAFAA